VPQHVAVGEDDAVGAAGLDGAAAELLGVQLGVEAVLREQLAMRAALDDASAVEDEDGVGGQDRRERCAIAMVVRPCIRRSSAACTSRSLAVSRAEVASSRMSTRGSASSTRAMASRCFSPPESR
jgi:hypothetical protein